MQLDYQCGVNDSRSFVKSAAASVVTLFLTLILSIGAVAQSQDARLSGTITDQNGAAVPNATVTVTNVGTNETRTATSGSDGQYFIAQLRPAVYTIAVRAQGFSENRVTDVTLGVTQQLDLPIALVPQGQSVSVTVTAASEEAVDTSSARLGATVNQREVRDLPLNGRQVSQLYLQAPGTVNTGTGTFGDIRFSGRSNEQNVIRYDGIEGSAIIDASPGNINGEVASPFRLQSSLENIQEFRADSNNYPAEFGTGTGGQISVVTKSGTNRFNGSLFEYLRNDKFDARNFFDNATAGIPKSKLRLNQFGGSIGGPIVKDKLFFFGSYEGYRVRAGVNNVELAPYLSLGNAGSVIPTTANPFGLPDGSAQVNAAVRPYIAGFRSPQAVSAGFSGTPGLEILQLQGTETTNEDAFFGRIDYHYSDRNTFNVRYFRDKGNDLTPDGVSGRNVLITAIPQNAAFAYQAIISPSIVNDFRFGFNGAKTTIGGSAPTVNGIDFSAISINVSGSVAQLPVNTISGQGAGGAITSPGGLVRANSTQNGRGQPYTPYSLSFIDSLSYTTGNHNTKFGGEIRLLNLKTDRLGGTTYTFSSFGNFLAGTLQSTQFLADLSSNSPFTNNAGQRTGKEQFYIVYGQDEWKIRPNLTLSYGLRYEYYTPLREKDNNQIYFDITTGTLRDPKGDPYLTAKNNLGPRVALTYSPFSNKDGFFGGNRTVLRGGFGIYYGPGQIEDQIQPIESNRISSTLNGGTFTGNTAADNATISNNFINNPNNRTYQPRAYSNNYKVPERVFQYSFSYQQELPYKLVSTVAYVGSIGRNLFLRSVANQILPGNTTVLNTATAFPTGVGVINRVNAAGQVTGVTTVRQFDILNNTAACNAAATNPICRPYAEIDYKTSGGHDSYNALQTQLARRFNTGLTLNAQYTFASSKGNTSGSNDARTSAQLENFEADNGRNTFDVRHSFNFSAIYTLPIGKSSKYNLGSVGNYLLGGLDIGGIINARSGLPLEILVVRPDVVVQCQLAAGCPNGSGGTFAQGYTAQLPTFSAAFPNLPTGFVAVVNTPGGGATRNIRRPDLIAGVNPYLNNDRNLINPAAFAAPAPGTFGNLPRNAFEGPIFRQFDLILSKKFAVTERANLQFRAEFFNLFNNTNFSNPSTTLALALPTLTSSTTNTLQPGQAYTQSAASSAFGQVRQTVGRTVGLGTNRQIQLAVRLNF